MDFTEVKPGKYGYKYLLVFIDTFPGWTEAYPTKHETAFVVTKKLLEEILPRFDFLHMIGSDNSPAFISQVSQGIAIALGAEWKSHCAYCPQSSGQVERINQTLKETLIKLALETGGDWATLLPYALFRVRNSSYQIGLTPSEIMYGLPPSLVPRLPDELILPLEEVDLLESLKVLSQIQADICPQVSVLYSSSSSPEPHSFKHGDWVLILRYLASPWSHGGKDPMLSS